MSQPRPSRIYIGANVALTVLFVMVLLGMANYMSYRHHKTFDLTVDAQNTLSGKTVSFLKSLQQPVHVYFFFNPEHPLYSRVEILLRAYREKAGDKIVYEVVDPQRDLARAQSLSKQYRFTGEDNVVILDYNGQSKFVDANAMADMEQMNPMMPTPPRMKAFKGEDQITSAMVALVQGKPSKVYFVTGHGEGDPLSADPKTGFSELKNRIGRENAEVSVLNLVQTPAIPADASMVVIAGPRMPFQPSEVAVLEDYMKKKGRLFIMLSPDTQHGLDSFLSGYGVKVDNNLVMGRILILGVPQLLADVPVNPASPHQIMDGLKGVTLLFNQARSVRAAQESSAKGSLAVELVRSMEGFWGETDYESEAKARSVQFTEGKDTKGPLPLAVAVDTGKVGAEKVDLSGARMVVVGSSAMFSNRLLTNGPATSDFFLNSMNWMMRKESLIGIAPKVLKEYSLGLTQQQLTSLHLVIWGVMPLTVMLVGFGVWLKRRS